METKKEKFGFGRQWLAAVIKWKDYEKLTRVSGGKMVGFVALLILLCSLVQYIFPNAVDLMTGKEFLSPEETDILLKEVPSFSIKNGAFSIDSPVFMDQGNIFIYADDNIDYLGLSDLQDFVQDASYSYQSVLIVTRTNLLFYNQYKYQELVFSDLPSLSLTFNEAFLQKLRMLLYVIMIVALVFVCLFSFGLYFLYSLIYSLFGMIFNAVLNGRLDFGEVYRASVYAKAGPACLFALLDMIFHFCRAAGLHPEIPFRFWLRSLLTLLILFFTISLTIKGRRSSQPAGGSGNPYQPAGGSGNPYQQPAGTQTYIPWGYGQPNAQGQQNGNGDETAGSISGEAAGLFSGAQPETHVTTVNGQPYQGSERQ